VQRAVCSNESCVCIVSQGCHKFPRIVETHIDEATVALGEELVRSGNVHALVVSVEKSKAEFNRGLSVDFCGVGDREGLVVAGGGLEAGRIRVFCHHGAGSLLSEGLASGIEVRDVADEFGSGGDSLADHSADSGGTGGDENSSEDWLALGEVVVACLESGKAALHRDGGAVDDNRAAGESSDDCGERRHVEKSQTLS
jgi:hypothetical protein